MVVVFFFVVWRQCGVLSWLDSPLLLVSSSGSWVSCCSAGVCCVYDSVFSSFRSMVIVAATLGGVVVVLVRVVLVLACLCLCLWL